MDLPILRCTGQSTDKQAVFLDEIFGVAPHDHAIYLDVRHIRANSRQGTHKSKERGEITGSTRKIKKQKGLGTARAGSIKSPIFRGGGRAFGPQPRDYSFKVNKKVKQLARKSALIYKLKEKRVTVIEDFSLAHPKTRYYASFLQELSFLGCKTLFVVSGNSPENYRKFLLASRNLKKARVLTVDQINTYDVLNADQLLISEAAAVEVNKKLA